MSTGKAETSTVPAAAHTYYGEIINGHRFLISDGGPYFSGQPSASVVFRSQGRPGNSIAFSRNPELGDLEDPDALPFTDRSTITLIIPGVGEPTRQTLYTTKTVNKVTVPRTREDFAGAIGNTLCHHWFSNHGHWRVFHVHGVGKVELTCFHLYLVALEYVPPASCWMPVLSYYTAPKVPKDFPLELLFLAKGNNFMTHRAGANLSVPCDV
ncbi:hypothetical protein BC835DRAFT_307236 [Cytidiella melzeri]|nr:hypothetical protein BC835DRAFT_307236 [Cytidiella melzeri]